MNRQLLFTYFTLFCLPILAQKQVKGIVVDDKGHTVFASVYTPSGLWTNCDSLGYFSFEVPSNENTIYIQSLGYHADTLSLTNDTNQIKVRLRKNTYLITPIDIKTDHRIENKSTVSAFTTLQKEIIQLNPQNVNEVLQTKPGFTTKTDYQAPITLRGLSGKRILILRNGSRRFSSYPAGVMSHTINVYDLERIEVEKGASSVVYGASAMAGIINLIDKSPFSQEGYNAKCTIGYGTINNEKNVLAYGGWSNGKLGIKASGRYRDADNFRYPDGQVAENSFYSDKDLWVTAAYQFDHLQQLSFTADLHDGGPWGKPLGFNGTNYMRVQTHKEKTNNYAIKYKQPQAGIWNDIELNAYYSNESREFIKNYYTAAGYMLSYTETTYFSDYYYGTLLKGNIKVSPTYRITTGGEFYQFHISTPTDAVDYIEAFEFNNRVSDNARSFTSGIFMEHSWQYKPNMKILWGIRYNYASLYEGDAYSLEQTEERKSNKSALTGNVASQFRLNNKTKLKINLARSFRMPATSELYSDNYTSNGILYSNSDLQAEFCNSLDIAYTLTTKLFTMEISPFFWYMNNMISKEEVTGMPGTNYTYVNIGKTRLFGGEVSTGLNLNHIIKSTDHLNLRVGLAYLNGTDLSHSNTAFDKGTPLDYTPPLNIKSEIAYSCTFHKARLKLALRSVYYSEQKRLGESKYTTPSYCVLGSTLRLQLPHVITKPTLNMSVNNLFNKEYYSYLSYLPNEGRDIRFFLTFHLN